MTGLIFSGKSFQSFLFAENSVDKLEDVVGRAPCLVAGARNKTYPVLAKKDCVKSGLAAGELHNQKVLPVTVMSLIFREKMALMSSPACGPITERTTRSAASATLILALLMFVGSSFRATITHSVGGQYSQNGFPRDTESFGDISHRSPCDAGLNDKFSLVVRKSVFAQLGARSDGLSSKCSVYRRETDVKCQRQGVGTLTESIPSTNLLFFFWGECSDFSSMKSAHRECVSYMEPFVNQEKA